MKKNEKHFVKYIERILVNQGYSFLDLFYAGVLATPIPGFGIPHFLSTVERDGRVFDVVILCFKKEEWEIHLYNYDSNKDNLDDIIALFIGQLIMNREFDFLKPLMTND